MKIKMNSNSKNKKKIDLERELNWNNRFNIPDEKLLQNYKIDNYNYLRPKNLRLETNNKNKIVSRNENKSRTNNKQSLINSKSYSVLNRNHTPEKPKIPKKHSFLIKNPLYKQITDLWDKLGISKSYQNIFENVCLQLSPSYRDGYFNNEINHLSSILNLLLEINSNIDKRKNIISLLKQFNNIELEGNENINEYIQKAISLLIDLRKISIIIVDNYGKLRQLIGYDLYINKFENDKIIDYNKDYLIEMKNDTDFLSSSNLANYFSFANENDPFLTAIANNNNNNNNNLNQYISIPIDEELLNNIKNCQYILLNEILNNELIRNNYNYRNLTCPTNNSSHSLISVKSNTKITKSLDPNTYLNDLKINKRIPSSKKNISNVSIKSYNHKKNNGFKKQTPLNNILLGSKYNSRYNTGERTPSRKKGKYEESKSEYKSEYSRARIETICERKKNELNNRINEKIKNQRNYYKNNNLSSPVKDDTLFSEEFINRSMNNQKIQIDQQSVSKKSYSKGEFSVQTYNNIENTSDNCSKNEEDAKDITSNIIKNKEDINQIKERLPLKMKLFSGNILDIINEYKSIYNKIPEEQKIGFHIKNDISYYLKGIYPKIILIQEGNNIKGLSIIFYDAYQINKSIKIAFICTIEPEILSESLKLLINFCNENLEYDEIKLDLFYGMKDGQFYLIESLEKCIKDDVKFKWINMENDGKDRKIQYKFTNPNLSPESILFQTGKYNVILKTACIISLDSINNFLENTGRKMNELNNFGIMSIIEELVLQYGFQIDDTNLDSKFQEFLKNLKPNKFKKMTNDFIQNLYGGSNDVISFIKENLDELRNKINPEILNNDLLGVSLMKIEVSFETVIQTVVDEYLYNIISNENIEVFTYSRNENEIDYFYFLRSTNDNIAFIIYELKSNSSLNNLINMNSEQDNIYDEFQRIYTKMNNQNLKSMKRIFLPSFKIENNNFHKKPSFLNAIQLSNDENEYQITHLNQVEKFNFSIDKSNKSKIKFDKINEETDIFIKNTFLMVIINTDLLCDLQIPTISSFVVQKDIWEKEQQN